MHKHKTTSSDTTGLLPNAGSSAQDAVERGLEQEKARTEQEKARTQKTLAPILLLPIALTGFLAYNRASALGPSWFALHPTGELMALSLMVISIIYGNVDGPEHDWRQNLFAILAVFSATFGAFVVFTVKENHRKPHFISPHSHLGLITFASVLVYTIISLVAFNPRTGTQRNNARAQQMHSNAGRFIVVLGLLTASAGILELETKPMPNMAAWIGSLATFFPLLA